MVHECLQYAKPLPTPAEGGDQGGQERLTGHTSIADRILNNIIATVTVFFTPSCLQPKELGDIEIRESLYTPGVMGVSYEQVLGKYHSHHCYIVY